MLLSELKKRGAGVSVVHAATNKIGQWTGRSNNRGYGQVEIQWRDGTKAWHSVMSLEFADAEAAPAKTDHPKTLKQMRTVAESRDEQRDRDEADQVRRNAGSTAERFLQTAREEGADMGLARIVGEAILQRSNEIAAMLRARRVDCGDDLTVEQSRRAYAAMLSLVSWADSNRSVNLTGGLGAAVLLAREILAETTGSGTRGVSPAETASYMRRNERGE